MKRGTPANYYVQVSADAWSEGPETAPLYDGLYTVRLNDLLRIRFVADVSRFGPPWTPGPLPAPGTDLTDPALIRLSRLLGGRYVVTPDDSRAGQSAAFDRPGQEPGDGAGAVFYVTRQEFAELSDDLEGLGEVAGNVHSSVRRDALIDHPVIRFLEDRVLDSEWLRPGDARLIERAPA